MDTLLIAFKKEALRYKVIGDAVLARLDDVQLHFQPHKATNSVAMLVHHLSANMTSRFTDFLTSDGEKSWRKRDEEFEPVAMKKDAIIEAWEKGWTVYLTALASITENDLNRIVTIRAEPHSVLEALLRQQAHYPYHIGQMALLAKWAMGDSWQSMSIPKNKSLEFLQHMEEKFKKA